MTAEGTRASTYGPRATDRDEVSPAVLDVVKEVFGHPVTEDDNFFDCGGDSVTAVDLAERLEERFGVETDMFELLEADDFAGIVDLLLERLAAVADRSP